MKFSLGVSKHWTGLEWTGMEWTLTRRHTYCTALQLLAGGVEETIPFLAPSTIVLPEPWISINTYY